METNTANAARQPWNKGKLVGQKCPFKLKEIWAIRIRLQIASRCRDLALFNLAIDSKLRACDLTQLRVRDVCHGQSMASRAPILQQKTSRPVQFQITEPAHGKLGLEGPLATAGGPRVFPRIKSCANPLGSLRRLRNPDRGESRPRSFKIVLRLQVLPSLATESVPRRSGCHRSPGRFTFRARSNLLIHGLADLD
jgi:hypothetical protein